MSDLLLIHSFADDFILHGRLPPGGKKFENAPKFKSSPQNNGISAAFLKQMLCGTSVYIKYLSKYNIKN
jgi:hypothetical protein